MLEDINNDNDPLKNLREWAEKVRLCEEKGHPFPKRIAVPYHPGSDKVLVECSGCEMVYERSPTCAERQEYADIMKFEFDI